MTATHQAPGPATTGSDQPCAAAATIEIPRPAAPRIDWESLRTASRACCCAARPAVVALIPPSAGRAHRTDLLLCMHHYRASRQGLARTGASVLDLNGALVDPRCSGYLPS